MLKTVKVNKGPVSIGVLAIEKVRDSSLEQVGARGSYKGAVYKPSSGDRLSRSEFQHFSDLI